MTAPNVFIKLSAAGINDLVLSMRRIQKISDDTRIQMIQEILDTIDSDHDGKIEIDVVLKVIDAVGRENVKVSYRLCGSVSI